MALIDRLLTPRTRVNPVQVVEAQDAAWGHPQETFAPPDYGDYVATSNDVYSTAMLRAKMLAKLPLDVYQGGDEPVTAGPLHDLINRPNPHYTRRKFLMMHELSLALWGQTYIVMETGGGRLPQELWWVKPTLMRPVPDKEQFIRGFLFTPPNSTDSTFFAEDEVVWIAYPNPIDEMSSLAPMAAVRLAADVSSASMKANRNLFRQGLMGGGFITPPDRDMSFSDEQARDLERLMERRFTGADKAHRWQVLRYALSMQAMSVTPKDAEFIDGMNLAFRHVARGMGVPPPLVGDAEFATLANLRVYERMFWEHTGEFAARFIEDELNRQLIPRFGGSGRVEFDLSDVVALQEDETEKWSREKDQIALGAITINEWREQNGLSAVEWGDAYWAPMNLVPTSDQETPESEPRMTFRGVEHQARWYRAMEERRDDETAVERELIGLFTRQEDQVLQQLRQRMRSPDDLLRNPFNRPEWASRFRDSILPHLRTAMRRIVGSAGKQVGLSQAQLDEVVTSAEIRKALERQAKRLGDDVNQTTWKRLRSSLSAGLGKGEDIEQLSARVKKVYASATDSRARVIAQSEITRADTAGKLHTWKYAESKGVTRVIGKMWMSSFDDKVRDSHDAAHYQTVAPFDNFQVGNCEGPGPGLTGCPEEDVNCRCVAEAVFGDPPRSAGPQNLSRLLLSFDKETP